MYQTTFRTIFVTAVIVQSLHMVEHIGQVTQKFVLHSDRAHGFIGRLDLEWVHLLYNTALLAPLYVLLLWGSTHLRRHRAFNVFLAVVLLQGYHLVEHVTKVVQHIETGTQGTPGILGHVIPVIWLHFLFNLIVLALLLIPFWRCMRGIPADDAMVPVVPATA